MYFARTLNKGWEKDPLYFVFKKEVKGKVKMHTKRLDMKDWIKIDKSYLAQMELRKEIMKQHENEIFVSSESMSTQHEDWCILEKNEEENYILSAVFYVFQWESS